MAKLIDKDCFTSTTDRITSLEDDFAVPCDVANVPDLQLDPEGKFVSAPSLRPPPSAVQESFTCGSDLFKWGTVEVQPDGGGAAVDFVLVGETYQLNAAYTADAAVTVNSTTWSVVQGNASITNPNNLITAVDIDSLDNFGSISFKVIADLTFKGDDYTCEYVLEIANNNSGFWAKITSSSSGTAPHSWQEVTINGSGVVSNVAGGRTGSSSSSPAYEINGRKGVPTDTVVYLIPTHLSGGDEVVYAFDKDQGIYSSGSENTELQLDPESSSSCDSDSSTWDRENQVDGDQGLVFKVVTRTCITPEECDSSYTSHNFEVFTRDITIDGDGHIVKISEEDKISITEIQSQSLTVLTGAGLGAGSLNFTTETIWALCKAPSSGVSISTIGCE